MCAPIEAVRSCSEVEHIRSLPSEITESPRIRSTHHVLHLCFTSLQTIAAEYGVPIANANQSLT